MNRSRSSLAGIVLSATAAACLFTVAEPAQAQDQDIFDAFDEVLEEPQEPAAPPPVDIDDVTTAESAPPAFDAGISVTPMDVETSAHYVRHFVPRYTRELPFLPNVTELYKIDITLGVALDGFVAPSEADELTTVRLGQPDAADPTQIVPTAFDVFFSNSALDTVVQAIEEALYAPQLTNYYVALDPADIDPSSGADLRPRDRSDLALAVTFDGPYIPISSFDIEFVAAPHPGLPSADEIQEFVSVDLVPTGDGFVSWRPGVEPVRFRLGERIGATPQLFSAGAVQVVLEAITSYLTEQLMAVQVVPARGELGTDPDGGLIDLRGDRSTLKLSVVTGVVREVRTLATGDRFPPEGRINRTEHQWMRDQSPIQPDETGEVGTDLLQKRELDEYLFFLSRHPGRRVDAAVARAPSELAGPLGVSLDYIVTENKPLLLYLQGANTGTEQTNEWRFRAGLYHNQLTGNDDILNVEYITADLDDTNAVTGRYEAMFPGNERLRWGVNASWSDYTASEVGFANLRFKGDSWHVGGEIAWNFFQDEQLFLDLVGGFRYMDVHVENAFLFQEGDQDFLMPFIGLRLERATEKATTNAFVAFEWNFTDVVSADDNELNALGRFLPDDDFYIFRFDGSHSFYMEPLLDPEAWSDPNTPGSTLAHEIYASVRGQYAFDTRLIPQMQQVLGGLYTIRGYDESVAVGDTVVMGTVEYRFHLPQAMGIQMDPGTFMGRPFRFFPQHAYGRADWDLVLRGFFDIGRVTQSEGLPFERDQTLMGAGVGVQLLYLRNLDVRVDWGFALEGISGVTNSGSNRVHVVATLLF
ncbi:MAG: ShlB/FhaC/HecB family hemolysin secretion/activation protein [Planctomycetes bacterium]|nr:ShlB/FhaC/HecB family hemolysin secretion/activation protein [Planctomycetota bacterium]